MRITGIEINGFKNIIHGTLDFITSASGSSILGLYGQNGSGKTALIDILELLKYVLRGVSVPERFAEYINVQSTECLLSFLCNLEIDNKVYEARYSFCLSRKRKTPNSNTADSKSLDTAYLPVISKEKVKLSFTENERRKSITIINTDSQNDVFLPSSRKEEILGNKPNKKLISDLVYLKRKTAEESRSFIFSPEFMDIVRKEQNGISKCILERFVQFGNKELFIINKNDFDSISLSSDLSVSIDDSSTLTAESLMRLEETLSSMNIVLKALIPGLEIKIHLLGKEINRNGEQTERIYLLSSNGATVIPLKYESDGIKKIISVLQLLILMFNEKSVTVAIDELDSGVFEYLLGEILKILSEQGKGQLIFTSHNLRPLELLDKAAIAFTTVNPANRYVRMKYLNVYNNLRDTYYRTILVGREKDDLYEYTDNAKIAMAFRMAGNNYE